MLISQREMSVSLWNANYFVCLLEPRYLGSLASVANEQHMQWLWDFSGRKPFWIGKYISCLSTPRITVPANLGKQELHSSSNPVFKCCIVLNFLLLLSLQTRHKLKAIIYPTNFISLYQKEEFILLPIAELFLP